MIKEVEIIDSITGSGKTTAICKWMDDNPQYKYIYISPLLSEVENGGRIHKQCLKTKFVSPTMDEHDTKSDHLLDLIKVGCNISCTHSLYLKMTEEHFKAIEQQQYVLIIDEELGMIDGFNEYSKSDLESLISLGCIDYQESDGMLVWIKDDQNFDHKDHKYYNFKRHVENGLIYCAKRSKGMTVIQLPIKLLNICKRVIIMTYLYDGNLLESFLKLKNIKSIPFNEFDKLNLKKISKGDIRKLISIHKETKKKRDELDKLNLSMTWYQTKVTINELNTISKYIKSVGVAHNADCNTMMYTFPKCRKNGEKNALTKIKPISFNKDNCWVYVSMRATNSLSHKNCLVHCFNRYLNQSVKAYLQDFNIKVDDDIFALSEMIQWVWRSAIRNNEPIVLAIASKRMKELFTSWLNNDSI